MEIWIYKLLLNISQWKVIKKRKDYQWKYLNIMRRDKGWGMKFMKESLWRGVLSRSSKRV